MKPSPWLAELYRQWRKARGGKLTPATRPFSRDWNRLLDAAGLHSAAERNHAQAEAESYQDYLVLVPHKYRGYLVEKILLPVTSEPWLLSHFAESSAQDLFQESLAIVRAARGEIHPRWPESWEGLCDRILLALTSGKKLPPFSWKSPPELAQLLQILYDLTAKKWRTETLIREASTSLGLTSKFLEEKERILESGLGIFFEEETTLESLGLSSGLSRAIVHGRLSLYFPDGSVQDFAHLRGDFLLSLADLQRAVRATTGAKQILSIENTKTTFRQAAAANVHGDTLLLATSFPNRATKRLLEILPADLPHHHYGDTDVSGYAILRSLREIRIRPVQPFQMDWRDLDSSAPLSERDRRLLPALKESPLMKDCRPMLLQMELVGRKGNFEQESRGGPALSYWPFWK